MSNWKISKDFNFAYGHRVYNQTLNAEYSIDSMCACRHLHGHEGLVRIFLSAEELTNGMVCDFKLLNWFKKWLDDTLDHKFIMGLQDPLLDYEVPIVSDQSLCREPEGHSTLLEESYNDLPHFLAEKYEGMVFVDFVPTSENLSRWIFGIVQKKMAKIGVKTDSVQFFETPKSQSIYTG